MKTIIITGASGNLGGAVTAKFLREGYRVMATVANITAKKDLIPHEHLSVAAVDLTSEEETTAFVTATIDKYQKVDAAVMLVGGFATGAIADTGGAELQKQISLNFETAYYITRPLFGHMMQNGNGRLIYIGSRPVYNNA